LKNYANAIKKAGGKVLHENAAQGHYNFNASNGKQIWVKVLPSYSGKDYRLEIIEEEAMRQDIVISADLIKSKIDSDGKATLQGIFFDTGKATLRDESEPALQEIAKYLKENPSVQCWVVGHTDSDGSLYINSKLSLDRAMAVKNELENKFNIKQGRLSAKGVGPLAPVASNKTEEGKQQNRRVELVLI
ncbi:MAG: OmpA family protein, partial [Flammeovirgaceae bacterium]